VAQQKFIIRIKDDPKGVSITTNAKPPITRDTPVTAAGFVFEQLLRRISEIQAEMQAAVTKFEEKPNVSV
jgi:hypothetical protein